MYEKQWKRRENREESLEWDVEKRVRWTRETVEWDDWQEKNI